MYTQREANAFMRFTIARGKEGRRLSFNIQHSISSIVLSWLFSRLDQTHTST